MDIKICYKKKNWQTNTNYEAMCDLNSETIASFLCFFWLGVDEDDA